MNHRVSNIVIMIRKKQVYCANCGGLGHIYKTCNHPVISYGVICYRLFYDETTNSVYPKYLMVQRKDSLCYVEFIRGKYDLSNKDYIMKLFTNMTIEERNNIAQNDFETLWNSMWCKEQQTAHQSNTRNFNRECREAAEKFAALSRGYTLVKPGTQESLFFDLQYILANTSSLYNETEWGFPKGRRNINEDDITCALREFREESGIHPRYVRISRDVKPLEEIFTGSNKIRYKHVYYVARYQPPAHREQDHDFHFPNKEVRDVQWFSYPEGQSKIRESNIERKELFKRLNQIIIKACHNI